MNFIEVQEWINGIKELDAAGDSEEAHSSEDGLLWAFVELISNPDNHNFAENNAIATLILDSLGDENYDADRYFS